MFNSALQWHNQGISTIPAAYKKPLVKYNQYKTELPTLLNLTDWFLEARCNIALITTEHLVVLDFDNPIEYGYWFCYQMVVNPQLIDTYMVMTSRGLHLYFWVDEKFDKLNIQKPYEVKSHGALVTIPPSIHQSGIAYRAINRIDDIKKVSNIQELLTFSYVKLERVKPVSDFWRIRQSSSDYEYVDLLTLFPDAKQTDETHWITDCPFHGNKNNFMIDAMGGYCFSGCGSFSAWEIKNSL